MTHEVLETPAPSAPPAERSSFGRTILRNALFVSSGGGLIRLLTFAYTIIYVRMLGESVYGQYATVVAFGALFGIFFELGTTQYVERTVAQDRARLPELLWMLVIVRLVLAVAGIALLPLIAMAVGYDRVLVISTLVLSLTYVLAALLAPLHTIFTSHERYDLWTASQLVGQLGTVAVGLTVLWLGGGLVAMVAVGLIVMPVQILYCAWLLRRARLGAVPFHFEPRAVAGFLRASRPFALTALALTVSFSIDTFLLSVMKTSEVVGWYSAAYRLVPTMVSILGGFLTVITPTLARAYTSDRESVHAWTRTSTKWLMIFSLPLAMATSLLAVPLITLLYGASFAPAAAVLAIIAWDIPLRLFNAFAGNVTAASNLERTSWRIFMTGTVLGVALYVPAILWFGMVGAAVITLLTDLTNSLLFFRLLHRTSALGAIAPKLLLVAVAAAVMGLVVWGANQVTILPVTVAAGMVTYAAAAWALGLIDQSLMARVAGLLSRRGATA